MGALFPNTAALKIWLVVRVKDGKVWPARARRPSVSGSALSNATSDDRRQRARAHSRARGFLFANSEQTSGRAGDRAMADDDDNNDDERSTAARKDERASRELLIVVVVSCARNRVGEYFRSFTRLRAASRLASHARARFNLRKRRPPEILFVRSLVCLLACSLAYAKASQDIDRPARLLTTPDGRRRRRRAARSFWRASQWPPSPNARARALVR